MDNNSSFIVGSATDGQQQQFDCGICKADNSSNFTVGSDIKTTAAVLLWDLPDGQQQQCVPQMDNSSSFIVELPPGQQQQFYCEVCHRWTTAAVCATDGQQQQLH